MDVIAAKQRTYDRARNYADNALGEFHAAADRRHRRRLDRGPRRPEGYAAPQVSTVVPAVRAATGMGNAVPSGTTLACANAAFVTS